MGITNVVELDFYKVTNNNCLSFQFLEYKKKHHTNQIKEDVEDDKESIFTLNQVDKQDMKEQDPVIAFIK